MKEKNPSKDEFKYEKSGNKAELNCILNLLPDPVYAIDLEKKIILWNSSMEKITGVKRENIIGKLSNKYLAPIYGYEKPSLADLILKSEKDEHSIVAEKFCPKIGESGIYVWAKASKLYDEGGKVIGAIEYVKDITEFKQAEYKIKNLYNYDSLTGTFNREYFKEKFAQLDTQNNLPIGIIMIDLNGLKLINDTYGYKTGDIILTNAAHVIAAVSHQKNILARWSGDEFVVMLPKATEEELIKITSQLKDHSKKTYVNNIPLSFATGYSIKTNYDKCLTKVLIEAENNMCKDKLSERLSAKSAVLDAILQTLEAKSYETRAHAERMIQIAIKIGEKLSLNNSELNKLSLLITLHDLGKIKIPEEILTKKGPLTTEEWNIVRKHPETGYQITKATKDFSHVSNEILTHHERWDGKGYPLGYKKQDIPLLSRITAIADAYEVMANGRPYKRPLTNGEIITEYEKCRGNQFDPELTDIFIEILKSY